MSNQPPQPFLSRTHIFVAAFFIVFLLLLYQAARLLAPFSSALLWASIIALALHPLYTKILRLMNGRPNPAAGVMTLFTFVLVIGPAVALFAALTSQVVELYHRASDFILSGEWSRTWENLRTSAFGSVFSHPSLAGLDIRGLVIKGLGELSSDMAAQVGGALRNVVLLVFNFLIMLFSLFFFFRDGKTYYAKAMEIIPFTVEQKKSITRRFSDTFSAVINGLFLVALLQGLMTGIGFAIFGIPFPVLWGCLAAILALLPVGGTALVWLPAALYLVLTGATLNGILLAVWGVVLVSLPDNFLKPLLIGRKAKLPTFFLFIGILGGIKAYGIFGILFGPLVVTLVTSFVQIYREEYGEKNYKNQKV